MTEMVRIEKRVLQCLYDLAISFDSMASGVMDTEDLKVMRQVENVIGLPEEKRVGVRTPYYDRYGNHICENPPWALG